MCLAIPAQVTELKDGNLAIVDILGVTREISLDLTPQAEVGSYVLVHAGFAIEVVDEQFAQETIDLIMEFPDLAGDDASHLAGAEAAAESGHAEPASTPTANTPETMLTGLSALAESVD